MRENDRAHAPTPLTLRDELADFSADPRLLGLSALAVCIGAASALVAKALLVLIRVITNAAYFHALSARESAPEGSGLGPWAAAVPVAGGLLIGLMARYGSEKIRGHGIPEALEAILAGESRMSPRVAVLKPVSSAISIGTGGPFGAEGPIIMTGGAVGSLVAQLFRLSAAERKTLLVAGAAAGMAAVFAAPVAALLLAVELLLFEWKPRSFIPVAFAAITASALRVPLLGAGPLFPVVPHATPAPGVLGVAIGVGVAAGLLSALATLALYATEDLFERLPLHWMWWPALGGAAVGLVGLVNPRVLGVGYGTIHALLRGELAGPIVAALLAGKTVAWVVALGSGTSGGVLAPLLIIGGALGALLGHAIPLGDPALWTLLCMAATMGGTMRSPFTATVFAVELTGDVRLLPALLAACVAAEAVSVLLLRRSILTEKVARRGLHLSREYIVDPLELARVGEVMKVVHRRARGRTARPARAPERVVAYADETVRAAVVKLLRHGARRLPVVRRGDPLTVVGYLDRADVASARLGWYRSEHAKDGGWPPWAPRAAGGAHLARAGGGAGGRTPG